MIFNLIQIMYFTFQVPLFQHFPKVKDMTVVTLVSSLFFFRLSYNLIILKCQVSKLTFLQGRRNA